MWPRDRVMVLVIAISFFALVAFGIALDFLQAQRGLAAKNHDLVPCGAGSEGLREQVDALHAFRARQEEQNARFEAAIAEAERLTGRKLR